MIEKIVAASLEKLLHLDQGKEQVVIEDEEVKGESERKEHMGDTWRSYDFASIGKSCRNLLFDFLATPAHSRPTTSSPVPLNAVVPPLVTSSSRFTSLAKDRWDYVLFSPPACLQPPFHPFSVKSAVAATVLVPSCYCRSF
ncbi:hypothetical protein JCGZ_09995 [Jatropha curcas]|uniref:Uncharacterized protein n=1 Tax=Jatropha curcas TaxID=180498 RepID=A0A067KW01_JATCU|nr:hypothetical protein JCGZ_09995 [Jatropha curcas]